VAQVSHSAIAHGVALARSINARVTILAVSTPFHTFAASLRRPRTHTKHMANRAAKYLNSAKDPGDRGRELRHGTRRARSSVPGHHRHGGAEAVPSYRHAPAQPPWSICDHAGQRNGQGAGSWRRPGTFRPGAASGGSLAGVFCAAELLFIENPLWGEPRIHGKLLSSALRSLNQAYDAEPLR
jgi:hypothetical protein